MAVGPARQPMDDVGLVAREVAQGQCILFLGAGVHAAPPENCAYTYTEEDRPPIGSQLSSTLAGESGFGQEFPREDPRNLQRVALHYERKFKRNRLIEEVRRAVDQDKKPSCAVRALAQLDFPIVITTNYDQIFERALRVAGKEPQISVYDPDHAAETEDCRSFSATRPLVFKIHGDIAQASSIVITDEDYIQFVMRMGDRGPYHPVPETVAYYMKRWPTLFVGYSLMDYNLRLLFKSLRWKVDRSNQPEAYSVDLYPDPLIVDVYANERRQVQFIAQDVWRFVPDLYSRVRNAEMPA